VLNDIDFFFKVIIVKNIRPLLGYFYEETSNFSNRKQAITHLETPGLKVCLRQYLGKKLNFCRF
jgi:hypothetical protein